MRKLIIAAGIILCATPAFAGGFQYTPWQFTWMRFQPVISTPSITTAYRVLGGNFYALANGQHYQISGP